MEENLQALTDEEKAKLEQEAAQKVVIQAATEDAAYFLDNLNIEGLSMRQLTAGESEYQMLRIAVQSELINRAEKAAAEKQFIELQNKEELRASADRELQLKRQNDELQSKLTKEESASKEALLMLNETKFRLTDAEAKRDAAVAAKEGLELLVSEKQEQIDILRKEVEASAKQSYKPMDLEAQSQQMKELAEKIKASRIHVYDVVPDNDINPKNFTAKRMDNGEIVTYNWTQENNYIALKDEVEASRFRDEHATQAAAPTITEPVQDTPLVTIPEALPVVSDAQFQPSVGSIPEEPQVVSDNTGGEGVQTNPTTLHGATVSRKEHEALEARVTILETRLNGV